MEYVNAPLLTICSLTLIVATLVNLIVNHVEDEIEDAWLRILHQKIPPWFDQRLLGMFRQKLQERGRKDINFMNSLYTYTSPRGYLGSPRWSHLEALVRQACSAVIDDSDFAPSRVVGIASGGAFIAPFVAQTLGVRQINYLKITKYGNKTNLARMRSLVFNEDAVVQPGVFPDFMCDKNEEVLVVDDQTLTGSTLRVAVDFLINKHAQKVKTLVVSQITPRPDLVDYSAVHGFLMKWPWGLDA